MVEINTEIQDLKSAVYGEDVRKAIIDALSKMNENINFTVDGISSEAQIYERFSDIPFADNKLFFCHVVNDGDDPDAPAIQPGYGWWNVIVFGGTPTRNTMLAFCPFINREHLYLRQKHDDIWYGWYDISPNALISNVAVTLARDGNVNIPMTFHWNGQPGTPKWLWGSISNSGEENYVWSPIQFDVSTAAQIRTINPDGGEYYGIYNLLCQYNKFGDGSFGLFINNITGDNYYYPVRTDVSTRAHQDRNGDYFDTTYLKNTGGTISGDINHEAHTIYTDGGVILRYPNFTYFTPPFVFPMNSSGYGGQKIYQGLICSDNIDSGIIVYIARGYNAEHNFISVDDNGNNSYGRVAIGYGNVYAERGFTSANGDYAEYWEYEDGNIDNEDRTGLFVTFIGNKIRIAQKGDNLVKVGVVSAAPSVIGDADNREWRGKYQKDIFGRFLLEDVENEDGSVSKVKVLSPDYDETQKYIKRSERPEWDAVGTHGKLVVCDDGTCQPDGFCVPTDGGIATAADDGFYVMERIDENHVRVYIR